MALEFPIRPMPNCRSPRSPVSSSKLQSAESSGGYLRLSGRPFCGAKRESASV